jgi:hypothetical protein
LQGATDLSEIKSEGMHEEQSSIPTHSESNKHSRLVQMQQDLLVEGKSSSMMHELYGGITDRSNPLMHQSQPVSQIQQSDLCIQEHQFPSLALTPSCSDPTQPK